MSGVDVVLVLDDSKSINKNPKNWPLIINFTASLATFLDIGLSNSLMGVMLFGGDAIIHFNARQYLDQASLVEAINNIEYNISKGTNTWLALDLLHESSQPNGAMMLREDFPAIAIVVTDGRSHNHTATEIAAQKLHDSKSFNQIHAIGIGRVNETELRNIGSDPSIAHILKKFKESDFNELLYDLSKQFCNICKLITLLSANDIIILNIKKINLRSKDHKKVRKQAASNLAMKLLATHPTRSNSYYICLFMQTEFQLGSYIHGCTNEIPKSMV